MGTPELWSVVQKYKWLVLVTGLVSEVEGVSRG